MTPAIHDHGDFFIASQLSQSACLAFRREDGHEHSANVSPTAQGYWEVFLMSIAPTGQRYGRRHIRCDSRDEAAEMATIELFAVINWSAS